MDKEKNALLICPFLAASVDTCYEFCEKEKCALWHKTTESCAFLDCAIGFTNLTLAVRDLSQIIRNK